MSVVALQKAGFYVEDLMSKTPWIFLLDEYARALDQVHDEEMEGAWQSDGLVTCWVGKLILLFEIMPPLLCLLSLDWVVEEVEIFSQLLSLRLGLVHLYIFDVSLIIWI